MLPDGSQVPVAVQKTAGYLKIRPIFKVADQMKDRYPNRRWLFTVQHSGGLGICQSAYPGQLADIGTESEPELAEQFWLFPGIEFFKRILVKKCPAKIGDSH
jgi:hypothetical protein